MRVGSHIFLCFLVLQTRALRTRPHTQALRTVQQGTTERAVKSRAVACCCTHQNACSDKAFAKGKRKYGQVFSHPDEGSCCVLKSYTTFRCSSVKARFFTQELDKCHSQPVPSNFSIQNAGDGLADALCGVETPASNGQVQAILQLLGRRLRIGIFAGSYSPVHLAHVMGALTMKEAFGLDCVWLAATYDKSFEKAHTSPETFLKRNRLLMATLQHIPFLRVVEVPYKYSAALPQLATARRDIDFMFLSGEDIIDEYANSELRGYVVQRMVDASISVGMKRRVGLKQGLKQTTVHINPLAMSNSFDYFLRHAGKPVITVPDFVATSSTEIRKGLQDTGTNAVSILRRSLGRPGVRALLQDQAFESYLRLLRDADTAPTTSYALWATRKARAGGGELVIHSAAPGSGCTGSGRRGLFLANLSPLRIQTLFQATYVFLISAIEVSCVVLRPIVPVPEELHSAIHTVLKRYPFLQADLGESLDSGRSSSVASTSEWAFTVHDLSLGSAVVPKDIKLREGAKMFLFPAWQEQVPPGRAEDASRDFLQVLPSNVSSEAAVLVTEALPPISDIGLPDGATAGRELPEEIFQACQSMVSDACTRS